MQVCIEEVCPDVSMYTAGGLAQCVTAAFKHVPQGLVFSLSAQNSPNRPVV